MNKTFLLTVFSLFLATNVAAVKEQVNITNQEPIGGIAMEVGISFQRNTYFTTVAPQQQVTVGRYQEAVMFVRFFHNGQYINSEVIPHGTHFKTSIDQDANAQLLLKVEREN